MRNNYNQRIAEHSVQALGKWRPAACREVFHHHRTVSRGKRRVRAAARYSFKSSLVEEMKTTRDFATEGDYIAVGLLHSAVRRTTAKFNVFSSQHDELPKHAGLKKRFCSRVFHDQGRSRLDGLVDSVHLLHGWLIGAPYKRVAQFAENPFRPLIVNVRIGTIQIT